MVLLMPFYAYESKIKHVLCEFCGFLRLYSKRIRDAALSSFIHHYTFAAKSKSIKYDSRRTI